MIIEFHNMNCNKTIHYQYSSMFIDQFLLFDNKRFDECSGAKTKVTAVSFELFDH
jgi:hypothetical protein